MAPAPPPPPTPFPSACANCAPLPSAGEAPPKAGSIMHAIELLQQRGASNRLLVQLLRKSVARLRIDAAKDVLGQPREGVELVPVAAAQHAPQQMPISVREAVGHISC
eukprot:7381346-Prymnesium_polylepis.1